METLNYRWDDPFLEMRLRAANVSDSNVSMILKHKGESFAAYALPCMFSPATAIIIEGA